MSLTQNPIFLKNDTDLRELQDPIFLEKFLSKNNEEEVVQQEEFENKTINEQRNNPNQDKNDNSN